jgi:prolyl oligopeptidase
MQPTLIKSVQLAFLVFAMLASPALAGNRFFRRGPESRPGSQAGIAQRSTQLVSSPAPQKLMYPATRKSDHIDEYHGTKVPDPYRWLEDPDSDETKVWVQAQNKVTFGYLEQIPAREKFRERLTKLWNYERIGTPIKRKGRYFYSRNSGLENQNAVYVMEGLSGQPRLLLDPNTLSKDGTIALANWVASDDGKLFAYALAHAGSDWNEWKILDVDTGRELPDHLQWVKFSGISWTPDGKGFFYSRYDEPKAGETFTGQNYYQKLFFHKLGDEQAKDTLIYERKDEKEWGFGGEVTEDGRYLVITVWRGTERKNQVFYKEMDRPNAQVVELLAGFDAEYNFIGSQGSDFYLVTDKDAPLRRLIRLDVSSEKPESKEVIPEAKHVLQSISLIGGHFIAHYLQDACSAVKVHDLDGKHVRDVDFPALGSASGFGGRHDDTETFYSFTNYTTPGSIYRYDVATGKSTLFREPKVDFDPAQFEAKQVFYTSRDGTKVPLMIVAKKGIKLDGTNPTILYGYGGFDIAQRPGFSVSTVAWVESGGIYAVANLRGGGEYGRTWHEAGMLKNKQNVFDDFLAAAQWLIDNKYTTPQRLAIRGGSNGGLLVGAAMTQRPDLFGAVVPAVGVMDMLRFHKFTIGWAWVNEYGSADSAEQFPTLLAYSPLHNLKPGVKYPPTLITTGDHDDRVVPAHSFKFAATLQAAHAGDAPVLIRIETRAGHGAGKPTTKLIEEAADVLAFLKSTVGKL